MKDQSTNQDFLEIEVIIDYYFEFIFFQPLKRVLVKRKVGECEEIFEFTGKTAKRLVILARIHDYPDLLYPEAGHLDLYLHQKRVRRLLDFLELLGVLKKEDSSVVYGFTIYDKIAGKWDSWNGY